MIYLICVLYIFFADVTEVTANDILSKVLYPISSPFLFYRGLAVVSVEQMHFCENNWWRYITNLKKAPSFSF